MKPFSFYLHENDIHADNITNQHGLLHCSYCHLAVGRKVRDLDSFQAIEIFKNQITLQQNAMSYFSAAKRLFYEIIDINRTKYTIIAIMI